MTCNCNQTLEQKEKSLRMTASEIMAQESVEISINEYLESQGLYNVTIYDKHYAFNVYMSGSELEEHLENGLVLNPQDFN